MGGRRVTFLVADTRLPTPSVAAFARTRELLNMDFPMDFPGRPAFWRKRLRRERLRFFVAPSSQILRGSRRARVPARVPVLHGDCYNDDINCIN